MTSTSRITEGMTANRLLVDLRRAGNAVDQSSSQISSGSRLLDAAVDPLATHRSLRLRQDLSQVDAFRNNVTLATGWMEATDEALGTITSQIHRVRELTVQGGNDAMTQSDRDALAEDVLNAISSVKLAANARYNDSYIFGGQITNAAPYDPTAAGPDTYNGDANAIVRSISPGVSLQINVTGDTIIGNGADGKLLNTLRDIYTALKGGTAADLNALRSTALQGLDTGLQDVLTARSTVGAGINRLEHATATLDQQQLSVTKYLNDTESTDMTETILQLNSQKQVYNAAIQVGSNLIQRSLMDFLR